MNYNKIAKDKVKKNLQNRGKELVEFLQKEVKVKYNPVEDVYTVTTSVRIVDKFSRDDLKCFADQERMKKDILNGTFSK